jgi:hypothetical protein
MLFIICVLLLVACSLFPFDYLFLFDYLKRREKRAVRPRVCTRQAPHICCVNGPCNGLPRVVPEAAEGTVPRPGSGRWSRAQYHSGNISLEELCCFYAEHPYDLTDQDR